MLKITRFALAIASASLAVSALAGNSSPQVPGNTKAESTAKAAVAATSKAKRAPTPGAFSYSGEGVGWEVTQHKYVWTGSGFAHSDECDHTIRAAEAITPEGIESARQQYRGG